MTSWHKLLQLVRKIFKNICAHLLAVLLSAPSLQIHCGGTPLPLGRLLHHTVVVIILLVLVYLYAHFHQNVILGFKLYRLPVLYWCAGLLIGKHALLAFVR